MPSSPDRARRSHRLGLRDLAALLVLCGLCLVFFWRIALTNRVLAGLDLFGYFYPYRDLVSASLRAGRLPLWNPYLFMGAPLLANSQAAVLYPLHWPLIWLPVPKQVAWSIVLHIGLAGVGTYLFGRLALHLRRSAALLAAAVLAFGGFLSAQVEHLNQLNASAWLPWLLLAFELAWRGDSGRWLAVLGGGAVIGLALLAGHTQAAYIVLFGTAAYALFGALQSPPGTRWRAALKAAGLLAAMALIGAALAAGQLLPTWELSRLSVRSGGLPYNEAASFSLKPGLVFKAMLPPLIWTPPFSEYVAYVGLLGLGLAVLGAWAVLRRRQRGVAIVLPEQIRVGRGMVFLAALGLFLAFGAYNPVYYLLYKLVPGFALFRAPARWLLLYAFGASLLAGLGFQALMLRRLRPPAPDAEATPGSTTRWRSPGLARASAAVVLTLVVLELFLAGQRLAYNNATAPTAFDSMRTAASHLLADGTGQPFRFLSMSDIGYDPGDMGDLQAMYASQLPEDAIYDLIVATKMKEVLAFNLPMRYRLFSVDGYDGGLLPTGRYVALEQLFLDEDEIWPDGRLRQQLRAIPPSRLLSLLNVKYVITDKTQDVWIDDVYYDLEHTVPLGELVLTHLPDLETTQLGVVSYLTDSVGLADGTPVARVMITDTTGSTFSETLKAGEHTAEGLYGNGPVAHREAQIGHRWRDNAQGSDYVAILDLPQVFRPASISVRSLLPDGRFRLRGMSLIHRPTGSSRSVTVDPNYSLVHSGDVKIYEHLAGLPRAYVVHKARAAVDDELARAALSDPGFDPAREVVLATSAITTTLSEGASQVQIVHYEPERIDLQVDLDSPGYLVLSEAYFPGWDATVDGRAAPILRADLYFRALALDAGHHRIQFRYRPGVVRLGLAVSLAAWAAWLLLVAILAHIGRKARPDV